ncbi:MAG: ubiquinol-cytochrome c reductase iron-sulfur subunit [Nitratireductor sp.]
MSANDVNKDRRDFLYLATGAMGAVGAAAVAWPFVDQMNPSAATRAAGLPIEVDVSSIEPGQSIQVVWRSKPYFIRRLTGAELSEVENIGDADLIDPQSPAERLGGLQDGTKEWAVVASNCTHLGCIPQTVDTQARGWQCACHGSAFDKIGRVVRGPAATNLPVPPFVFADANKLVVGTDNAEAV